MNIKIISEKKVKKTRSTKFNSRLQEVIKRYVPGPEQYDETNVNKLKIKIFHIE